MIEVLNARIAAEEVLKEIKEIDGKLIFPIDPFRILRLRNVIITFSDFDKLEGLLLYDVDNVSLVSINKGRPIKRQRFTAAHELGHIMLHSNVKGQNFLCPIYGSKDSKEKEANEFASNLLMPTFELEKQIDKYESEHGNITLDDCLLISEYFGVSFESCLRTISYRLKRILQNADEKEISKIIRKYKPDKKRVELLKNTNDIELLANSIAYSHFSMIDTNKINGIKFIQNLVYHDNKLEGVDLPLEKVTEILADLRMKGSESDYSPVEDQRVIECLGNIEMNSYVINTNDKINIFKIKDLNKLLYTYAPFPEYGGEFRTSDNIITNARKQPISVNKLLEEVSKLNDSLNNVIENIEKYSIPEYISIVCDIHYRLTVLHPFNDGNGRMSRAFLNWLLVAKGVCPIYIDSNNKQNYIDALHIIDDGGTNQDLQIVVIKAIINSMAEEHKSWR